MEITSIRAVHVIGITILANHRLGTDVTVGERRAFTAAAPGRAARQHPSIALLISSIAGSSTNCETCCAESFFYCSIFANRSIICPKADSAMNIGDTIMAKKSGGGGYRRAISGRYVTTKHGKASPRTTVHEVPGKSGSSGPHYRSAISGRYVTTKHGKASPRTTVKEY